MRPVEEITKIFKLLNVDPSSSYSEIVKAYRRAMLKYHPDRKPSKTDVEIGKEINDLYLEINSEEKLALYRSRVNSMETLHQALLNIQKDLMQNVKEPITMAVKHNASLNKKYLSINCNDAKVLETLQNICKYSGLIAGLSNNKEEGVAVYRLPLEQSNQNEIDSQGMLVHGIPVDKLDKLFASPEVLTEELKKSYNLSSLSEELTKQGYSCYIKARFKDKDFPSLIVGDKNGGLAEAIRLQKKLDALGLRTELEKQDSINFLRINPNFDPQIIKKLAANTAHQDIPLNAASKNLNKPEIEQNKQEPQVKQQQSTIAPEDREILRHFDEHVNDLRDFNTLITGNISPDKLQETHNSWIKILDRIVNDKHFKSWARRLGYDETHPKMMEVKAIYEQKKASINQQFDNRRNELKAASGIAKEAKNKNPNPVVTPNQENKAFKEAKPIIDLKQINDLKNKITAKQFINFFDDKSILMIAKHQNELEKEIKKFRTLIEPLAKEDPASFKTLTQIADDKKNQVVKESRALLASFSVNNLDEASVFLQIINGLLEEIKRPDFIDFTPHKNIKTITEYETTLSMKIDNVQSLLNKVKDYINHSYYSKIIEKARKQIELAKKEQLQKTATNSERQQKNQPTHPANLEIDNLKNEVFSTKFIDLNSTKSIRETVEKGSALVNEAKLLMQLINKKLMTNFDPALKNLLTNTQNRIKEIQAAIVARSESLFSKEISGLIHEYEIALDLTQFPHLKTVDAVNKLQSEFIERLDKLPSNQRLKEYEWKSNETLSSKIQSYIDNKKIQIMNAANEQRVALTRTQADYKQYSHNPYRFQNNNMKNAVKNINPSNEVKFLREKGYIRIIENAYPPYILGLQAELEKTTDESKKQEIKENLLDFMRSDNVFARLNNTLTNLNTNRMTTKQFVDESMKDIMSTAQTAPKKSSLIESLNNLLSILQEFVNTFMPSSEQDEKDARQRAGFN